MIEFARYIGRVLGGFVRAIQWSLSYVDDQPAPRAAPSPGPAHGPITAIEARVGRRRPV